MKILLLGEYSGVFTELKKGLDDLGHDTFLISDGDGQKKYKSDFLLPTCKETHCHSRIIRILAPAFRLGLKNFSFFLKYWGRWKKLTEGYDAVLFVNPVVYSDVGSWANYIIAKYVLKHNKKIFLSVLGDDYYVLKYYAKHRLQNGYYNPRPLNFRYPDFTFKYIYCLGYKKLNDLLVKQSKSILPGALGYALSYEWTGKVSGIFPFPISSDRIGEPFSIKPNEPIIIFHGWQRTKESRKGNDVFDRVIHRVVEKYGTNKIDYRIVSGVPYDEYIKMFRTCHIFIDQLYAMDKGMNGLLGMAAGKVVFSGFKPEALCRYKEYDGYPIGVSSCQDEDALFNQFCELIDNPSLLETISTNAIRFVKEYHLTSKVAQLYINEISK